VVSTQGIRKELAVDATAGIFPGIFDKANLLAAEFAERASRHDREASFPFENFDRLSEAGLLALTVPTALGGSGAGARDTARILNILGKADPSTALVLSMHYIQHLVMARSTRWPGRLARRLARETSTAWRWSTRFGSSRIWVRHRAAGCRRRSPGRPRPNGGSVAARSIRPARRS
jgi:hypothetical protein